MVKKSEQVIQNLTVLLFRNAYSDEPKMYSGFAKLDAFHSNLEGESVTVQNWEFPNGKENPDLVLTIRSGRDTFSVKARYFGEETQLRPPRGKNWEWYFGKWRQRTLRGTRYIDPEN